MTRGPLFARPAGPLLRPAAQRKAYPAMARIKVASPIAGIRGTLGGLVFSRNQSGSFCRAWSRGANPRSATQQPTRLNLSTLPADWRALTQVQRDAWDTYAAAAAQEKTDPFGTAYYVSGWNWYVAVNQWRATVAQSAASAPPSSSTPAAPTITDLTIDEDPADTSSITFSGSPFSSAYGVVYLAVGATPSALAMPTARRRVALTAGPSSGASTFNFSQLQDIYGALQQHMTVWAWAYAQSTDGRRGAPDTYRALVVAS